MSKKAKQVQRTLCEVYSRVNGYLRPISNWNDAKLAEHNNRKMFKIKKDETLLTQQNKTRAKS